jgi:hypothetical protein
MATAYQYRVVLFVLALWLTLWPWPWQGQGQEPLRTTVHAEEQTPPGLVPRPDPSLLTTQQILREILSLRQILETRIEAIDKQLQATAKIVERLPSETESRVGQLQALHGEKFRSIENQFASSKLALDSALQASEKSVADKNSLSALAIAKAETQATKQTDQLQSAIVTAERTANDKIITLKERLDRIEGQANGISSSWFVLVGVFGIISVCLAIFVAIRTSAATLEVQAKKSS